MFPQMLLALLTDSSGHVLLVRRKDSLLWSLPGSVVRAPVSSRTDFLAACCRRQIGLAPDFPQSLDEFTLVGQSIAVGVDEVSRSRVRACGRVAETRWFQVDALPLDVAPVARLTVMRLAAASPMVSLSTELVVAC